MTQDDRVASPPTNQIDTDLAAAEAELAVAQKQMAWEMSKAAVDAAGLVDPTPISDGIGAAMSLADGDVAGAGLSLLSMLPYVGDVLGKTAKGARTAKVINRIAVNVAALTARIKNLKAAKAAGAVGKQGKRGIEVATNAVATGMRHIQDKLAVVTKCPKMQKAITDAAAKCGIRPAAAVRLLEIAKERGVTIRMRPTNKDAKDWIMKGHPPKPGPLKMKTINEVDTLIGAPKESKGLVGYFKPKMPDSRLEQKNPELYKEAMNRYWQRAKEYCDEREAIKRLEQKNMVTVQNGVVIDKASGKGYTGDNDIFDIRKADGSLLSETERNAVVDELRKPPVSAQHPDHMSWETKNRHEQEIKDSIINKHGSNGEALGEFGPDGFATSHALPSGNVIQLGPKR